MIASTRESASLDAPAQNPSGAALLPSLGLLMRISSYAILPFIAAALMMGRTWWAISLLAGYVISAAVGGLLHLVIGRAMGQFLASRGGSPGAHVNPASMLQFVGLAALKFIVIAALAWAIVSIHQINVLIMLAGFLVCHMATIVAANVFLKRRASRIS